MLKIRAGWSAVVGAGLCLLMVTSVFAADDYWLKTSQKADINGSYNQSSGVANTNSAAGNLNNQNVFTSISIGRTGGGFGADNYLFQGYSGTFIVGNAVYGQGVFTQETATNPANRGLVVLQQTVGFFVDARHTLGQVAITHSFQGYAGVATVNQAAGNLNNQVTTAGIWSNPSRGLSSIHAGSPLLVYSNLSNNVLLLDKGSFYKAVIDGGSFRNYSGMLAVSQTAGNLNNTVNSVGLSVNAAPEHGQALSNKNLENVTALSKKDTNVIEGKGERPETKIEHGAFQNFTGVASISQVAGNMNQVVTQVGVSVH